jgi:CxxC motif-containing protein (DUF1111 family)
VKRLRLCYASTVFVAGFIVSAAVSADGQSAASPAAGGATTVTQTNETAFSRPAANLGLEERMDFLLGEAIFQKIWVPAPASTTASDGLGPLHNARSCSQCHVQGGRGHPDMDANHQVTALLRLSIAPQKGRDDLTLKHQGRVGDPHYGGQLQLFAVAGAQPEAKIRVRYSEHPVTLADGTELTLRKPHIQVTEPAYGDFDPDLRTSLRLAPPMIGLGLLERIPESRLEELADPDDLDRDGISGRINRVYDQTLQQVRPGRFGWKAGQPSLAQQNANALNSDLGIGNPIYPSAYGDCTARQTACLARLNGNTEQQDGLEASATMMRVLEYYTAHIAVPAARIQHDPIAQRGERVFRAAGCSACHTPTHKTRRDNDYPALSEQMFSPYTDLLLHDMGDGLADRHTEFEAMGREWRTPPLWGLGLTKRINGHYNFLHDGRARSLLEAILWHGGEGQASRDRVINMKQTDRTALLRFLESL